MSTTYIFVSLATVLCTIFDTSGLNLIRRPSIPLHHLHLETSAQNFRRFNRVYNINYRKTKEVYDTPGNLEAVETFDTITYRIPIAQNKETNDDMAKMTDKNNKNDLHEINNYIVARRSGKNEGEEREEKIERSENSERREWNERQSHAEDRNDKNEWVNGNSHLERLVQNIHRHKEGSPVHRLQKKDIRDTAHWTESGAGYKSEILRNLQKLSLEDRKLQLKKFREELKWMTTNTDDTSGIGIQM